jgi:hypothetical protein
MQALAQKHPQPQTIFRTAAKKTAQMIALILTMQLLTACGINNIPAYDEQVKAGWAEVQKPVPAPCRFDPEPGQPL